MLLTLLSPQSQQYKRYPQQSSLQGWGGDLMYPRNNASPPIIDLGEIVLKADGTQQTTGVSARVKIGTGAWGAAAGSLDVDATSGVWTYTPTQAETNADYFIVAAYKSACTSVSKTIITSNSATSGQVRLEGVTHTSAVIPTVTTTTTATNLTNLPAIPNNWLTAAGIATDAITEIQAGVRTELATELGRIDATISSRATVSGIFAGTVPSLSASFDAVLQGLNAGTFDTLAETAIINLKLPMALVDGRIEAFVGAMGSNVVTAASIATDAVTEIQADLPTKTDVQNAGLI